MDEWSKGYDAFRDNKAFNINNSPEWQAGWNAANNAYEEDEREMAQARRGFGVTRWGPGAW
jgi:hypothetical protein